MKSASYVVPARNEAQGIAAAVGSLLAQETSTPFEVIVVDHESTDATASLAEAAGARLIASRARTVAGARNDGAAAATGELLCFVDADCRVESDHLERVVAALEPDFAAAGAGPSAPEGANRIQTAWALQLATTERREVSWLPTASFSVRRAAFEEVGGFDERLVTCEDSDIGHRLRQKGHRLVGDPRIVVRHQGEPATLGEFFRKEVWRGHDSLRTLVAHGCPPRELLTVLYPPAVAACPAIAGSLALVGLPAPALGVAAAGALAPLLPAIRTGLRHGRGRFLGTLYVLYAAYALARCVALLLETGRILRRGIAT